MTLEQNKSELHQKYFMADLESGITRHFEVVFMELVDQLRRVLQICRKFPIQLDVSLPCDFVLWHRWVQQICLYLWGKNCFYLYSPKLQGRWLAWVVEGQGSLHQLGACDHVRPLPMPELPVKSDGIYRATLWLRNSGHSHRLHN